MRIIKKKIFETFIDINPKLLLKKKNIVDKFEKINLENNLIKSILHVLALSLNCLNKRYL